MARMQITDGKGVHFTFDNDICISIQIGRGNYGDNYDHPTYDITRDSPLPPSTKAEIAVWSTSVRDMANIDGDVVKGYVPVEDVLRFMEFLRPLPEGLDKEDLEQKIASFNWRAA